MEDLPIKVWKKGLECPDDTGNSSLKEDIRKLLKHRPSSGVKENPP